MKYDVYQDKNYSSSEIKRRITARGFIRKEDKFLVVYLKNINIYNIPGGGLEEGESLSECLKREMLEETGIVIKEVKKVAQVNICFRTSLIYEHNFYLCEVVEETNEFDFTVEEQNHGMVSLWLTYDQLIEIFNNHESDYKFWPETQRRDLIAILELKKHLKKN